MIDVHSHIIHGVGDGPSTIEESLKMVHEAEELGIKVIFATPHLTGNKEQQRKVISNFKELVQRTADNNISLILGYEICVNASFSKRINQVDSLTMGNTRFVLVEFPVDALPEDISNIIYELQVRELTPIIAHPERNLLFVDSNDAFLDLFASGCLIQVNIGSVLGFNGRKRKAFVKKFIKKNMIHFIGSDVHKAGDYAEWYLKAYQKVLKWTDAEYTEKLFYKNPAIILEDTKLALHCSF